MQVSPDIRIQFAVDLSNYIKDPHTELIELKREFINEINILILENLETIGDNFVLEINLCIKKIINKYIEKEKMIDKIYSGRFAFLKKSIVWFNELTCSGKYSLCVIVTPSY